MRGLITLNELDLRDLLQEIANICALRHQIDSGFQEGMAERRADLLACIGKKLYDAGFGEEVDAF